MIFKDLFESPGAGSQSQERLCASVSALVSAHDGAPPGHDRSFTGAVSAFLMLLLLLGMLVSQNAQAQLPVGGFLGPDPLEEEVEEMIQEQLEDEFIDVVEESLEAQVEQVTQLNIQENIEENIEEAVEQNVDEVVESSVEDSVASTIEEQIEGELDNALVQAVEEDVEAQVEDAIASTLEDSVEDGIEEAVEAGVEESIEASVEDAVAATVEEGIEGSIENSVESSVESSVEDYVESSVESTVEQQIEDTVETAVVASVEDSVEASVEASLEDVVETTVTEAVEDSVESAVEESVAQAVSESVEASVEASVADEVELRISDVIEERIDNEILDNLESDLEVDEGRILKEQWLVMAEPLVFDELTSKGYLFDTVTELPGLGLRLAEVAAPSTFDITDMRDGVLDVVGKDRAEVDLNHIYTASAPVQTAGEGVNPRTAIALPSDLEDLELRVGMIDSGVDTAHPALADTHIETRSFAAPGAETPEFHGTAIASIIAANSSEYKGLAPSAQLYAASVFELDDKRGEIASTVSLIRALDWLISSDVEVVNISLAGPPNRLLERALDRASKQDIVVMAAAGNGGPVARPMYPAAYDSVVAVTAVDSTQQVFRLANRGDYLALAAPGVDLRHAQPGGGYVASSGTSFAVPFAVTAAARIGRLQPEVDVIAMLLESATDLGPPGRDKIYGYGLLTLNGP